MKKESVFSVLKKQWFLIKEVNLNQLYFYYFMTACFGGAIPVLSVFYTKLIVEVIESSQSEEILIGKIVALSFCCILCFIINSLFSAYSNSQYISLRQNEFNCYAKTIYDIDYHYIEGLQFQDKIQVGFTTLQSDDRGFQNVYKMLDSLFSKSVTIILLFFILGRFNIWIIFICTISIFIVFIISCKSSDYEHKKEEEEAKASRQVYGLNEICCDFSYEKRYRGVQL